MKKTNITLDENSPIWIEKNKSRIIREALKYYYQNKVVDINSKSYTSLRFKEMDKQAQALLKIAESE